MNKKGAVGLVAGLTTLFGGVVFIYLLIVMFGGGAVLSLSSSKVFIMFGIGLLILWMLTRKR